MQPQTDAEMHAWNYGVDLAAIDPALAGVWTEPGPNPMLAMSAATAAALDTLGRDLFGVWVARGYATARATQH